METQDKMEALYAVFIVLGLLFGLMLFDNPLMGVLLGAALVIILKLVATTQAKKTRKKAAAQIGAMGVRGRWAILAGVAILTIGIYATIYMPLSQTMKSTIVSVGAALLVVGAIMYWRSRKGELLYDERTLKIQNKALATSWWLTYVFVAAMFWADSMGVAKFTMESFGGLLLFEMIITCLVAKEWLERKRDVQ